MGYGAAKATGVPKRYWISRPGQGASFKASARLHLLSDRALLDLLLELWQPLPPKKSWRHGMAIPLAGVTKTPKYKQRYLAPDLAFFLFDASASKASSANGHSSEKTAN